MCVEIPDHIVRIIVTYTSKTKASSAERWIGLFHHKALSTLEKTEPWFLPGPFEMKLSLNALLLRVRYVGFGAGAKP